MPTGFTAPIYDGEDMYRKSKAVKGIHYDSEDNPILAYV